LANRESNSMKKVLVTGATGFIGNYVVEQLLHMGCTVIASSANTEKAGTYAWFSQVQYIPFQLEAFDPNENYYQFFHQPDLLIHLAWEGLPNYKGAFHTEINLPRHFSFLQNLVQNGLQDIAVTGTCFEYGMQEGRLQEDMPVFPDNFYAKAKHALRLQLQQLQQQQPFCLKWVRLFYMYGKGQNPKSLLSQLDKALESGETVFNMSGGEQVRDYLPVAQVAEYIVKIALQQQVTGVINCCSGVPLKVIDLVKEHLAQRQQTIALNLGYYPYPDYEPFCFWGDDTKLKSILTNAPAS
jgi:nucleoside-diphosphate-sugar epimerase